MDLEYDPLSPAHDLSVDRFSASIVSMGKRPLIIDCGANIGLSSIWLSERFPDSTIVSIEPELANFKVLELNATAFPNIVPVNAAISDNIGYVKLHNPNGAAWAWRTEETNDDGIRTTTISELCARYGDHLLLAVKMDIEGFEVNVLRDGARWVDDLPLLIFEMHDWMAPWSGSGHSFFSTLSRHKRDYLIRGENIFSYRENKGLPTQD